MTDTPTKQAIQSNNDQVPGAMPSEQKKNNRNNDRKRNRRGDSKNLERDSDWQERVVQIRRVSKTVKGGKKMSLRAIVVVGNEAAKIRSIRPPEPYKGKGIKYHDERILRKAGKSGKK